MKSRNYSACFLLDRNRISNGSFADVNVLLCVTVGVYVGVSSLRYLVAAMALLCLARLLPVTRLMRVAGDHSLVLLGLNGIFLNVLNVRLTSIWQPAQDVAWQGMAYAVVISALSMLVCLPVAIWLEKYLPQLTGRPMLVGPLLPALYRKK